MTPRAAASSPLPLLAAAAATAVALCAPALQLSLQADTGPLPVEDDATPPRASLPCEVLRDGRDSIVRLANDSADALPRGTRIAWATTGTPAPQGHWHWLAHALQPGQGLSLPVATVLHGSGCVATRLH